MDMRLSVFFLLLVYLTLHSVNGGRPKQSDAFQIEIGNQTMSAIKMLERDAKRFMSGITKIVLPFFVRNQEKFALSSTCLASLMTVFLDLKKMKMPAIKLLDASARPPAGALEGVMSLLGDYDECLSIKANRQGYTATASDTEIAYQGQYCTVDVRVPQSITDDLAEVAEGKRNLSSFGIFENIFKEMPMTTQFKHGWNFLVGLCIPSTCTTKDLESLLRIIPLEYVPIKVKRCLKSESKPLTIDQAIVVSMFSTLAVLVVVGTTLEITLQSRNPLYREEKHGRFSKFLMCFSLYTNTRNWIKPQKIDSHVVKLMHGCIFWSAMAVLIYHSYYHDQMHYFSRNLENILGFLDGPTFIFGTQSSYVDTFFIYSGFFLVYGRFSKGGKNPRIDIISTIVKRYLRLAPSFLLVFCIAFILPLIGSGPLWNDVIDERVENAHKWWWTYVLMGNNYLLPKDQSFIHLWFIPCVMQLTVLGVIMAWLLAKNAKVGVITMIVIGVLSNLVLGIVTVVNNYPPLYSILHGFDREHFERVIFSSPLSHISSYFIGILAGYYRSQRPTVNWPRGPVMLVGLICAIAMFGIQMAAYSLRYGGKWGPLYTGLYASCHKIIFIGCQACLFLMGSYKYFGAVRKFYCWSGYGPLSKLTYWIYLVHYIVITCDGAAARTHFVYEQYNIWMRIACYVSISLFLSYLLHVTFEVPFAHLVGKLMARKGKTCNSDDTLKIDHLKENGTHVARIQIEESQQESAT